MSRPRGPRLLAITPPAGEVDPEVVAAWCEALADTAWLTVLLREPGRTPAAVTAPDGRLAPLLRACDRAGVRVVLGSAPGDLHESVRLCHQRGFAGVQLRGDPGPAILMEARDRCGDALLGRSCHGEPQPGHEWVDYTVLAPMFPPRSGAPKEPLAAPLATLALWAAAPDAHIVAVGGVEALNADALLTAGAGGLGGIFGFFGEHREIVRSVRALTAAVAAQSRRREGFLGAGAAPATIGPADGAS